MQKIVWILLFSLVQIGCVGLFYYPTQRMHFDPEQYFKVTPEEHWVVINKNRIHLWWFRPPSGPIPGRDSPHHKGTILFFHGNAENLSSHYAALMWILKEGYEFVIFDYPGYGQSSGKPNLKDNLETGHGILRWLHEKTQKQPLIIYGQSLGGNIGLRTALDLRHEIPIRAVIVDSAFQSYPGIAREKMSEIWLTWPFQWIPYLTLTDRYSPQKIDQLSPIPLMLVHCENDPVVSARASRQMFDEALEPKKILLIKDCPHGGAFFVEQGRYQKDFLAFINKAT